MQITFNPITDDATANYGERFDAGLIRVDDAAAVPRPAEIDRFYVEEEAEILSEEQPHLWDAAGTAAARPADEVVGRLDPAVASLEDMIERQRTKTERAMEIAQTVYEVLGPFVRRPAKAKRLFYAKMLGIFAGDIAGVASAAILFGLMPWMAVIQAVSIGAAAVAAGGAGAEFKDLQLARKHQQPLEDLDDDLVPYRHYFRGGDGSEPFVKIGIAVALVVVLLIFGGVFALQAATDSLLAGLVFGCLGAAVGLASFANYWTYTDDIADHVERADAVAAKETATLAKLTESALRKEHGEAQAQASSIRAEHEARGEAARLHLLAEGVRVLRTHPGVGGHGYIRAAGAAPTVDLVQAEGLAVPDGVGQAELDQLLMEEER
jgi:hypothetical protein